MNDIPENWVPKEDGVSPDPTTLPGFEGWLTDHPLAQEANKPYAGLSIGSLVHYVMPNGDHLPAFVTAVWDNEHNGTSNLNVFTDYSNSVPYSKAEYDDMKVTYGIDPAEVKHGHIWRTSILYSKEPKPNTWHWPEK